MRRVPYKFSLALDAPNYSVQARYNYANQREADGVKQLPSRRSLAAEGDLEASIHGSIELSPSRRPEPVPSS